LQLTFGREPTPGFWFSVLTERASQGDTNNFPPSFISAQTPAASGSKPPTPCAKIREAIFKILSALLSSKLAARIIYIKTA